MVWSPPGQSAPQDRWRYDLSKKLFTPPGIASPRAGTQVALPQDFQRSTSRGFHLLTSPAGNQAPADHINYTPETGEIHGRGQQAPVDKLNYTLLPEDALGAGHGAAGSSVAQGMGVGQGFTTSPPMGAGAASSLFAPGMQKGPFAGTPPLSGSPSMSGGSPTLNRTAPQWGGGGVPMAARMGMGQSVGDTAGSPNLLGGSTASGTAGTDTAGTVATDSPGGTSLLGGSIPTQNPNAQAAQGAQGGQGAQTRKEVPGQRYDITDENGKVRGYRIKGTPPFNDEYHWLPDTKPQVLVQWNTDTQQYDTVTINEDGTTSVAPTNSSDPSQANVSKGLAQANLDLKIAQKRLAEADAKAAEAKGDVAQQQAQAELAQANAAVTDAQARAQQAQQAVANAKGPQAGQTQVTADGSLLVFNNDTKHYEDTGYKLPAGTWTSVPQGDGSVNYVNLDQGRVVQVSPPDPTTKRPNITDKNTGDVFAWKGDLATGSYQPVFKASPGYDYTWSGDEYIQTNRATGETRSVYTKKPSQAEQDVHRQSMATLATELQGLRAPAPTFSGGMMYVPQGANIDVESFDPATGATGHHMVSGGPLSQATQDEIAQIQQSLNPQNAQPTPNTTPHGSATQSDQSGTQTAGSALSRDFAQSDLPEGTALSRRWSPAPTPFTQSDIAEGTSRSASAPDDPEAFKTYTSAYDFGGGHESMGAGTGTPGGWTPRPAPFSRATGPGWLGGVGAGQGEVDAPPGPTINTGPGPQLPGHVINQGEVPGQGPSINTGPGAPQGPLINTGPGPDMGPLINTGQWAGGLADLVKQQVHESLRELLGWPKLPKPEAGQAKGTQGGFDVPEQLWGNPRTRKAYPPSEPSDIEEGIKAKGLRDLGREFGKPQGMSPEEWDEMQQIEGLQSGTGRGMTPEAQAELDRVREDLGTTGAGQQQPQPSMAQPAGWQPSQPNPQNPPMAGKPKLPKWLESLLKRHPELLQRAGLAGGAPTPTPPTSPGGMPPAPPMGGGQDQPATQGAQSPPVPGPGGAPMQPPLPPGDVAGIGHRFGQSMDVGEPQHSGVDLQAPEGTPTQSPVDGVVADVTHDPNGLGLTVIIQGKDGSQHKLGHLSKTSAYKGMQVARGQDLGSLVGSTGLATGAHLHWGVKDAQGQPQDPTSALPPDQQTMPPVPGTEQMGPTGGTGAPSAGAGQDARVGWPPKAQRAKRRWGKPNPATRVGAGQGEAQPQYQAMPGVNTQSPDYQAGYQAGIAANASPGTPPLFMPSIQQPTPGAETFQQQGQMGGGQDTPEPPTHDDWANPWANTSLPSPTRLAPQIQNMGAPQLPSPSTPQPDGGPLWTQRYQHPQRHAPTGASGIPEGTPRTRQEFPLPTTTGQSGIPEGDSYQSRFPFMTNTQGWLNPPPQLDGGSGPWGAPMRNYVPPPRENSIPIGSGQEGADERWDKYQAREVQGAMGAGGQSGMGAGGMRLANGNWSDALADTPENQKQYGQGSGYQGSAGYGSTQYGTSNTTSSGDKTGSSQISEYDKNVLAQNATKLKLDQQIEDDTFKVNMRNAATAEAQAAETARHNKASEELTRQQQALDLQLAQLDSATKVEIQQLADANAMSIAQLQAQTNLTLEQLQEQNKIQLEQMTEANQVKLESMKEGNAILMQQGQQAYDDWTKRRDSYMSILSGALNNPWLQQLSGMAPQGQEAAVMGGGNIQALLNKILAPYDYSSVYGDKSQTGAAPKQDALNANATGTTGAAGATGQETTTPTWAQWQSWSPWQKAAYRTNVEALGPGAWQTQQQAMQSNFGAQGGSADVTQLAAGSADTAGQIGQQMTAEAFGQTPQQWQTAQSKRWSQSQAPQVRQSQGGATSSGATPESQYGV
jgi:murein DD-endopeptidase MepM/ murein hydrolase activator NlpD